MYPLGMAGGTLMSSIYILMEAVAAQCVDNKHTSSHYKITLYLWRSFRLAGCLQLIRVLDGSDYWGSAI